MPKQSKKALEEVKKCQGDFAYFCKYLKILDKSGNIVPFKPNYAQKEFYQTLEKNPWIYTLKARQLGMTTAIAAHLFWKVLFTPNFKCAVLAHTQQASKNIFEIYHRFHQYLPKFLKFKCDTSNVNELKFFHGGGLKVSSATSSHFRGSTFNAIHASELCFYNNLKETIASIFQTVADNSEIIIETTANGLNEGYRLWMEDNGFGKLFIPWYTDKTYTSSPLPNKGLNDFERKYKAKYKLTNKQMGWVRKTIDIRCGSDINIFHQEYPASANLAFITTGTKFFNCSFPEALKLEQTGLIEYSPPVQYRSYAMGVDSASGSPTGDYSAAVVVDITDRRKMFVAATYYKKEPLSEFASACLLLGKRYNALACIESNNIGMSVIDRFQMDNYQHLYRRTQYDKIGNQWVEKLGFNTSPQTRPMMLARLQEHINKKWLSPVCQRIKYEINSFVYNQNGKPEAASGQHDDLVFATALALMSIDQADSYTMEVEQKNRPHGIAGVLEWEANTGKLYKNNQGFFDDEPLFKNPMSTEQRLEDKKLGIV